MSGGYTRYPALGGGSGSGNVNGPASSVDGQIALFSGTSGTLLKVATGTGLAHITSGVYSASLLVDADVSATAAIAYSKLALSNSIVNADIATAAAIAYSKLNLSTSILNADISASAAIAYSKLALSNSVVNADIASAAAIAYSKLAALSTGQILLGNAGVPTATTLGGDVTVGATGTVTIAANAVTNAKMATMAANTVKANVTGGAAVPTDVAIVSAATASTAMIRDASANVAVNNTLEGYTTTATAAGTTTLLVGSTYLQYFTGVTTQTVLLPVASTLVLGQQFSIVNNSTGVVTVQSSGANTVQAMTGSSSAIFTCILTSGTTAASWSVSYVLNNAAPGTVTSVAATVPAFMSVAGSPITGAGTLAISLSGTALPATSGGTGQTSVIVTPAASTYAGWDANKNLSANSTLEGYTTTATAAGTTTLLVGSTFQQYFTGSSTQTVKLPVTSTLVLGQSFQIVNNSTGAVTVQSSGANNITILAGGSSAVFTCILTSGTTAASWSTTLSGVTGSFAQAFFDGATSWSTTSATLVDPTVSGSAVFTVRSSVGITLTAAASSLPGITFTPANASAVYLISATFGVDNTSTSNGGFFSLTDGTTQIAGNPGFVQASGTGVGVYPCTMSGPYSPGTTSAVTVKLRVASTSGTVALITAGGGAPVSIEWTVLRIA